MPDMVELFVAAPDGTVWAICSGGRLLRAAPDDWSWSSALPPDADITRQVGRVRLTATGPSGRCGRVVQQS